MKNTLYKSLLCAFLVTGAVSCSKYDESFNVNPANPSPLALQTRFLLSSALQGVEDGSFSINAGNFYVQYLAEGPYPGASLYTGKNFDWAGIYTGPLYDLQQILNLVETQAPAAAEGNGSYANQKAVATILQSFLYIQMTDRWGAIPYKNALKGSNDLKPVYDSQESIYADVFVKLSEAVSSIDGGNPVAGDLLLGGDMEAWKRFANTLRMSMALRLSKVDAAKGKAEYNAAITADGGVISSNDENIEWNYIDDPAYFNPWYQNYTISNRNDYAISDVLANYMLDKGDKRIEVYAEELAGATPYKGLLYGSSAAKNIPGAYSRVGDAFRGKTSPARIFNYPQVLFMQAEAAKIGYIEGGDAAAALFYADAIKASWEMNGVFNLADFTAYLAEVAYVPASGYEQIMTEKWVHNYLNGYEAWNDWRRTGYPVLEPAEDAVDTRGIPVRQGYPTKEGALNRESYEAAVATQGVDDNYTFIWWDK